MKKKKTTKFTPFSSRKKTIKKRIIDEQKDRTPKELRNKKWEPPHKEYRLQTYKRRQKIRLEELKFQQKLEELSPFYRSCKEAFQEAEKTTELLERRFEQSYNPPDVFPPFVETLLKRPPTPPLPLELEKMEKKQLELEIIEIKKKLAEYEKILTSQKPMERSIETHPSLPLFSSHSVLKPIDKWEQWLEELVEIRGFFSKFSFSPRDAQIRYNGKILLQFESPIDWIFFWQFWVGTAFYRYKLKGKKIKLRKKFKGEDPETIDHHPLSHSPLREEIKKHLKKIFQYYRNTLEWYEKAHAIYTGGIIYDNRAKEFHNYQNLPKYRKYSYLFFQNIPSKLKRKDIDIKHYLLWFSLLPRISVYGLFPNRGYFTRLNVELNGDEERHLLKIDLVNFFNRKELLQLILFFKKLFLLYRKRKIILLNPRYRLQERARCENLSFHQKNNLSRSNRRNYIKVIKYYLPKLFKEVEKISKHPPTHREKKRTLEDHPLEDILLKLMKKIP